MGKIIRLTESDLTRLVRRVIKEQSTSTQGIVVSTPDEYGKAMFKALGPNFQVSAHQVDFRDNDIPGTYNSYFIQKYMYSDKWGNDGVSLKFNVKYYDLKSSKLKEGLLDISIIFTKGVPTSLGPCMLIGAYSLSRKDIMSKIFPKIKGITYNTSETSKNGIDDSCLKNKGFEFIPKNTNPNMRKGPYGNLPASYQGNYEGNKTIFYLNNSVKILGKKYHSKSGEWKCESGKLKVFNVSDWKLNPPT